MVVCVSALALQIKPKGEAKLKDAKGEPVWTDREVLGLGKVSVAGLTPCARLLSLTHCTVMLQNYMTEAARRKAISVYTRYIQLFALKCLADRSATEGVRVDLCASDLPSAAPSILTFATTDAGAPCLLLRRGCLPGACACFTTPPSCCAVLCYAADKELWKRQASLVALEFKSNADIVGLLALYREMLVQEAERTRVAKSKDSVRGKVIIPDYDQVHPSADRDSVVLWMKGIATGQAKAKM